MSYSGLRTVQHALDVLETLAEHGEPLGVTELASRLSLPKATAYRLISTLESRGYLAQDPDTSKYWLGLACLELGMLTREHLDLRSAARPHLKLLNERTKEIVHLAIYDSGDAVYIDKLDSHFAVSPKSRVGLRAPAFAVAPGRVLLAYESASEIEAVLEGPLTVFTEATVVDSDVLHEMLEDVLLRAYATNFGSWRDEVCGVAAPIRNYTGSVIASVGCCVPSGRFTENLSTLRDETLAAAKSISEALGYVSDTERETLLPTDVGHAESLEADVNHRPRLVETLGPGSVHVGETGE